jgi:Fe-S cluster assembly iron-binding protein IscA
MLVLTDAAASAIRRLAAHPEFPDDGGLRIAAPANGTQPFTAAASRSPDVNDTVVERDGAKLFLGPDAAQALDDKVLDARTDDDGTIEFRLLPQPGMESP